jgi:hypothetical protein
MISTLSALGAVQLSRAGIFAQKVAENPTRALTLEPWRRRNAVLDAMFYDVGVISPDETGDLSFWLAREGAILIVPPSRTAALRVCLNTDEYFDADDNEVAALAVAGVGSSALGAAAFARNVADALGAPVAAVVSGYGLADVLTEALGGFFLFGALNSMRHAFEGVDNASKSASSAERSIATLGGVAGFSEDTATVVSLLEDGRFSAKLLVGHSKGNLVISEALYAVQARSAAAASALAARYRIVTISAKIGMPEIFARVVDVMGEWDGFGALNSRPDIPADFVVPHAWHSTNREFPYGMGLDVTRTLRAIMPTLVLPPLPARRVRPSSLLDLPQRAAAATVAAAGPRFMTAGGMRSTRLQIPHH